jgi:kynurenine formamidase
MPIMTNGTHEQRVIDLSQNLFPAMPSWQTQPELKYDAVKKVVRDGSNVTVITQMSMHMGTHVDAPLHSIQEGRTIDQYTLEQFMGEGVVIDLRAKTPGQEITEADLRSFDDTIGERDIVFMCTDWSKRRGLNADYLYRWPYLGQAGCSYLVKKRVKAVGTESMSIAGWSGSVPTQGPISKYPASEIHRILLEAGILVIEGLSNLSAVLGDRKHSRAFFVFAPLNFVGSEASPCRAFAFLDDTCS